MSFRIIALALFCLAAGRSHAASLYAIDDTRNQLLRIDPGSLALTVVGSLGVTGDFGDLSYNPRDGKLYWVPGRGNNNLYTVDTATGVASLLGAHGIDDLFALAWDTTHQVLYAQSAGNILYTLDPLTAAPTPVGTNAVHPGGLVYRPDLDRLFLLSAGLDRLYSIDTSAGTATVAGGGLGMSNNNGITYDPDRNVYWVANWSSQLVQYDAGFSTRTLELSHSGRLDGIAYISDIPEPGSVALIAGGLTLVAWLRRRVAKKHHERV